MQAWVQKSSRTMFSLNNVKCALLSILKVLLSITLAYVFFVLIYAYQCFSLYQEGKSVLNELTNRGLSAQFKSSYNALLPKFESIVKVADSKALTPVLWAAGVQSEVLEATRLYRNVKESMPILPSFLGFETTRRYFVAFQNPAEARGTGGLLGAFSVIQVDKGSIKFEQIGSNSLLANGNELPISLPEEYLSLYNDDPAWWVNSNNSPHFPYAAQIWLALWERQFGERLDGVIALDPFVLKRILERIGTVQVGDRIITEQNVVEETLFNFYLDFQNDNLARKNTVVDIIASVAQKAYSSRTGSIDMAIALANSIRDERVFVYSANADEQSRFRRSTLSGALDRQGANDFRLVLVNTAGNKMDYFINRSLKLEALNCRAKQTVRATIEVANEVKAELDLPDGYYGRLDLDSPENPQNSTSVAVLLFGPPDAKFFSTKNSETDQLEIELAQELGREVLLFNLDLAAGESKTLIVDFKGVKRGFNVIEQRLVRDQKTKISDGCNP